MGGHHPVSGCKYIPYIVGLMNSDEVTNNRLERESLTKSSWMRPNLPKLRASSLFFFYKYYYVIKNVSAWSV